MGVSWTIRGIDQEWMMSKLPRYEELCSSGGGARKKNPARNSYVHGVIDEYKLKFPGRLDRMDLSKIRFGGTEIERTAAIYKRFDDFFGNQLRTPATGVGGKREVITLTDKGGKRLEQNINCYYRLYRDTLKPALDKAYIAYQTKCAATQSVIQSQTTFKNKFLSERFKDETEETRNHVLDSRRKGGDRVDDISWLDEDSIDEVEAQRRRTAYELHNNITKSTYTLERAAKRINEMTGWNVVWAMCGPDPKRGGDVQSRWSTEGTTIPNDAEPDGLSFENWFGNWHGMLQSLGEFSLESTTREYRASLSLEQVQAIKSNAKGGKSRDLKPSLDVDEPVRGDPNFDAEDGLGDLLDPALSARASMAAKAVPTAGGILTGGNHAISATATSATSNTPTIPTDVSLLLIAPTAVPSTATPATSNTPTIPTDVSLLIAPIAVPSTVDIVKASKSTPTADSRHVLGNLTNCQSTRSSVIAPRSTRSTTVTVSKEAGVTIPKHAIWLEDAMSYISGALDTIAFVKVEQLRETYLKFEGSLGFQVTKTKSHHLPGIRPRAITTWAAKRQRDLWFTPPEIFPPEKFIKETRDWWCSLQPPTRLSEQHNPFHFGGRVLPVNLSEWDPIRRGGPNGFFLVVMALSWMPEAIASLPPTSRDRAHCNAVFEALICDVEWVLVALHGLEPIKQANGTVAGRKRKSDAGSADAGSSTQEGLSKRPRKAKA